MSHQKVISDFKVEINQRNDKIIITFELSETTPNDYIITIFNNLKKQINFSTDRLDAAKAYFQNVVLFEIKSYNPTNLKLISDSDSIAEFSEVRCSNCGKLLLEYTGQGLIRKKCPRCNNLEIK